MTVAERLKSPSVPLPEYLNILSPSPKPKRERSGVSDRKPCLRKREGESMRHRTIRE